MHDVTVFKDSHIGCLDGNDNGAVFKNFHFETRFQTCAIWVPKTPLSCKQTGKMHKSFPFLAENVI